MTAYASAVSLMHIIDLIKNHPSPPISLDKEQFHSLTEVVTFLQEFLEGFVSPFSYSDEADPLEMRIAEAVYAVYAVYAAEDVIESYIVDNIHLATTAAKTTQDYDVEDYCDYPFDKYNGGNDDNDADNDHGDGGDGEDHGDDERRHGNNDDDDDGEEMESYKVDNRHLAAGTTHDDEVMESYIVDNIQLASRSSSS